MPPFVKISFTVMSAALELLSSPLMPDPKSLTTTFAPLSANSKA